MDPKIIALLITGVVIAAGAGLVGGYLLWSDNSDDSDHLDNYEAGYAAGRTAGYSDGYDTGYEAGNLSRSDKDYNEGYSTGYNAGRASSASNNNAGYNAGYKDGYEAGYDEGAAAGYEEGYADGFDAASTTYWFYIDFGNDSAFENEWLSARSNTAFDALKTALDSADIPYSMSSVGAITSIGDAGNYDVRSFDTLYDEFMEFDGDFEDFDWTLSGYTWYHWFWSTNISYAGSWIESDGYISQSSGFYFYIGFSYWEWDMYSADPLPTVDINPNAETSWNNGGPFA